MGYFRFRRSFRLFPGVRLNLSRSGVSTSIGRRGLWFTSGPRGTRETVGIPGTGISYTEQQSLSQEKEAPQLGGRTIGRLLLWAVFLAVALVVLALAVQG